MFSTGFGGPGGWGYTFGEVHRDLSGDIPIYADDISVLAYLDELSLLQNHLISLEDILVSTVIDSVSVTQGKTLQVDSIRVATILDAISIVQNRILILEDLRVNTSESLIDIVNWDKLGVYFGQYGRKYGYTGELSQEDIDTGRFKNRYENNGELASISQADTLRYKDKYIQEGRF